MNADPGQVLPGHRLPSSRDESRQTPLLRGLWHRLALVLALAWIGGLALLVLRTANPVTLQLNQMTLARDHGAVVLATVEDALSGRVQVERVLSASPTEADRISALQVLVLSNLVASGAVTGARYVIPVIRRRENYVVVETGTRGGLPLVYADTADAIQQAEAFSRDPSLVDQ